MLQTHAVGVGGGPPTKPWTAEPRTTAWSQYSVNHPGHHAGAQPTRVNHNRQGTHPAHARPTEWGSVCGGRLGQCVEEQDTWASHTRKRSEAGFGRPEDGSVWTAKTVKQPPQQPAQPQFAIYWAPLTRKRHMLPHPSQPQHTNHWAPRTRKRHQQEHRPQQPTESSDLTQYAKERTVDCPGPHKETTTRRNVTQGGACVVLPYGHGNTLWLIRQSAVSITCEAHGRYDEPLFA